MRDRGIVPCSGINTMKRGGRAFFFFVLSTSVDWVCRMCFLGVVWGFAQPMAVEVKVATCLR